jgi:hypothetical protein
MKAERRRSRGRREEYKEFFEASGMEYTGTAL